MKKDEARALSFFAFAPRERANRSNEKAQNAKTGKTEKALTFLTQEGKIYTMASAAGSFRALPPSPNPIKEEPI